LCCSLVVFFQAEDGIRDRNVTGVQTCALPISTPATYSSCRRCAMANTPAADSALVSWPGAAGAAGTAASEASASGSGAGGVSSRSEERRVGKEGRERGWSGDVEGIV